MSVSPVLEKLQFRALNNLNYRWAIVLIVASIIVPAVVFMTIVVHYDLNNLSRGQVVLALGVGGITSFFIVAFIFSKFLAMLFTMTFYEDHMKVKSGNSSTQYDFKQMQSLEIWNNSDYAKLIVHYHDQKIKFHVGFANLLKVRPILEVEDKLDLIFSPQRGFTKRVVNHKGICKITYTLLHPCT
ncbi:hypothetical protein [Sphingobacterium paucimobilis]|uniref:Uncharacterized protein n=1 Tax=Sphingobacterium paucimobilis HER1398 TaxID=1346330 RepID=U2JCH2_9SPHI|nr:hypothetical protein [Sphingobacterium paucimobilis]ERJ60373.1 hypothetical protein M472_16600 [Sphingobacterium paucimobilis HER1398]